MSARRARRARSAGSTMPTAFFREADRPGAQRRGDQHRVGRPVPREVQQQGRREVVPGSAEGDPRIRPGAARHGARAGRRESAAGGGVRASARSSRTRTTRARTCSSPRSRSTRTRRRTRASRHRSRARGQSEAPRGAVDAGGAGLRRGPRRRNTRTAVAAALKINPTYGEVHRVVGSITAHYYRFDEAVEHVRKAIALDRENVRALRRPRRAPDAHRRRAQRAPRARDRVQGRSVGRQSPTTCSSCSTRSSRSTPFKEGDMVIRLAAGRSRR